LPKEVDDAFFKRADAHIHLANAQLAEAGRGKVSASLMYAVARFNAWISACDFDSASEMRAAREEAIEYFVNEYRTMLIENLDQYIENFESFMQPPANKD
jgi:Protein of unknown function (DUF3144)